MKARDLLILLAIVLVGGFAVADALRRGAGAEEATERGTTTNPTATTSGSSRRTRIWARPASRR